MASEEDILVDRTKHCQPIAANAIVVEAEDYARQRRNTVRSWYTVGAAHPPAALRDADPPHVAGARGGAYLEILPDTRIRCVKTVSYSTVFF